jgi:hypothetical protein
VVVHRRLQGLGVERGDMADAFAARHPLRVVVRLEGIARRDEEVIALDAAVEDKVVEVVSCLFIVLQSVHAPFWHGVQLLPVLVPLDRSCDQPCKQLLHVLQGAQLGEEARVHQPVQRVRRMVPLLVGQKVAPHEANQLKAAPEGNGPGLVRPREVVRADDELKKGFEKGAIRISVGSLQHV